MLLTACEQAERAASLEDDRAERAASLEDDGREHVGVIVGNSVQVLFNNCESVQMYPLSNNKLKFKGSGGSRIQ